MGGSLAGWIGEPCGLSGSVVGPPWFLFSSSGAFLNVAGSYQENRRGSRILPDRITRTLALKKPNSHF